VSTGADDLSCFLIDYTGERTTRTPKGQQKPINEYHRRKVIHYIAYADEYPDRDYDHGVCALCLRLLPTPGIDIMYRLSFE
jgi:hypothetical protein